MGSRRLRDPTNEKRTALQRVSRPLSPVRFVCSESLEGLIDESDEDAGEVVPLVDSVRRVKMELWIFSQVFWFSPAYHAEMRPFFISA
jgi:hypothetical protein